MEQFYLKGDFTFEAESIDDAWLRLAAYFLGLAINGADNESIITSGHVTVEPIKNRETS